VVLPSDIDEIMNKKPKQMTNAELWELFPIILSEHKPEWKENYNKEKNVLEQAIGIDNIVRMNHIGSTAIPGLIAKPTIDILVEIKEEAIIKKLIANMKSIGYIYSEQPKRPAPHMMFMKGYTPQGFKGQVFHIHIKYKGDWDELYFRDYLMNNPEIADEYGKLKIELQKLYEHDRDGYTHAKTNFVKRITGLARTETGTRY
jgi:GrpB-like predicted nucleotidyltransferase (UPF0157 family)